MHRCITFVAASRGVRGYNRLRTLVQRSFVIPLLNDLHNSHDERLYSAPLVSVPGQHHVINFTLTSNVFSIKIHIR